MLRALNDRFISCMMLTNVTLPRGGAWNPPKASGFLRRLNHCDRFSCVTNTLQTGWQIPANYHINPYPGCFFSDRSISPFRSFLCYCWSISRASTRSYLDPTNPLYITIDQPREPQLGVKKLNEILYEPTAKFSPRLIAPHPFIYKSLWHPQSHSPTGWSSPTFSEQVLTIGHRSNWVLDDERTELVCHSWGRNSEDASY